MMKQLVLLVLFLVLSFNFCWAKNNDFSNQEPQKTIKLEEIVVTPLRYEETSANIPANVSIITSDKIKDANYQNVLDVLKQESGLIVRDYYGTGHKASVDLRGFGETAGMNTLVLIDGRRTNQIDLSGVDWKQIPIERIKRIEIIQGSGNVLYGDNASAGVINIITKTGKDKPNLTFESIGGSFQTRNNILTYEGKINSLAYSIGLTSFSTNGYRQNSDYKNTDIGAKIIYDFDETLSLKLSGNYHNSDFGLPGALRTSQLKIYSRKESLFPEDTVGKEDWYLQSEIKKDLFEWGKIKTSFSFRRRRVDNNLISSQSIDGRRIDTVGINAQYILESVILAKKNKFNLGIDYYNTNSIQDKYSGWGSIYYSGKKMRDTDIDKKSIGVYLQDTVNLSDKLNFVGGYRYEQAKYTFDSSPQSGPWISDPFWSNTIVNDKLTVDEEALTLGLNYNLSKNTRIFFNHTKGFRFPATDEYYSLWSSPPVNTNLKPQTSKNYELGITTEFIKNIHLSLNLFNMNIENELYYNPLTSSNENYGQTKHQGLELGLVLTLWKKLTLRSNYTYTKAFFDGGIYDNNQIPLVPHHKASIAADYKILPAFTATVSGNYTGKRYFISDQAHNYSKLDDYFTLDLKLNYQKDNFDIFFEVKNLFNEMYSEYGAISTMYSERGYYPSPGRSFRGGVKFNF